MSLFVLDRVPATGHKVHCDKCGHHYNDCELIYIRPGRVVIVCPRCFFDVFPHGVVTPQEERPRLLSEGLDVANVALERLLHDVAERRAALVESFFVKYLQDKDLKVGDIELVERYEGSKVVWYPRKKGSSE